MKSVLGVKCKVIQQLLAGEHRSGGGGVLGQYETSQDVSHQQQGATDGGEGHQAITQHSLLENVVAKGKRAVGKGVSVALLKLNLIKLVLLSI